MRILHITPGAGESYDCENCLRDNSLVWALRQAGHDVELLTLYLPPRADREEEAGQAEEEIFFGGVNVYLQQSSALFRHTPRWLDQMFDWRPLLKWASKRAGMTSSKVLGETTLSMLEGESGRQAKELARLCDHVATLEQVDVVVLSNLLISGFAPALSKAAKAPVVCLMQDEDYFLDDLGPYAESAWALVRQRASELAACVAVSRYYAGVMRERLALGEDRLRIARSAIHARDFQPPEARVEPPVLTFVSPLNHRAGADRLLEVWAELRKQPEHAQLGLKLVGIKRIDDAYVEELRARAEALGLSEGLEVVISPDRLGRIECLRASTLLVVPTREPEAFGRYVLEAMACETPAVLPDHGAFCELIKDTGGGVLFSPHDMDALRSELDALLRDDERRVALGAAGRAAVLEHFSLERFAAELAETLESVKRPASAPA